VEEEEKEREIGVGVVLELSHLYRTCMPSGFCASTVHVFFVIVT
jgi:hypothetical protein